MAISIILDSVLLNNNLYPHPDMEDSMKCIKCGTEDFRINGEDKVFCKNCLKQILNGPVEDFDINSLNWD
jgi:DNA-directed RNA polymerase subunit RPC12/RpoP